MKKITLLFLPLLLLMSIMVSCNNDDPYSPPSAVENSLILNFPDASNVYWINYGTYKRAIFNNTNDAPTNAFFNSSGLLLLTSSDIAASEIPSAVSTALDSSAYSTWDILTEAMLSRINMGTLYSYTVASGDEMFMLYYNSDGTLEMKLIGGPEDNSASNVPISIVNSISYSYRSSLIVDAYYLTSGDLEVEILHDNVVKLVVFNESLSWQYTYQQIEEDDVPDDVFDTISTKYGSYTIKKVYYMKLEKSVVYYQFDLTNSSNESIVVTLNSSGEVITTSISL